jgi:hypothetical protein
MDDMREQFGDSTRIGCTLWIGECMGVKTSMLMRSGHAFLLGRRRRYSILTSCLNPHHENAYMIVVCWFLRGRAEGKEEIHLLFILVGYLSVVYVTLSSHMSKNFFF